MSNKDYIYRVLFISRDTQYEIYCKKVLQSDVFGFIELEELVFGDESSVVVDPSEERLKNEFEGVEVSFIPMHAILRIDRVEKEGTPKMKPIGDNKSNIAEFPSPIYTKPHNQDN